jgi:hypothetical protein
MIKIQLLVLKTTLFATHFQLKSNSFIYPVCIQIMRSTDHLTKN